MIKYSIVIYLILGFLFLYEINLAVNAKTVLEKKVKGISTQVKEIDSYTQSFSDYNYNQ